MKKLFPVVALFCLMTACNSKKKDETKPADNTTSATTSTTSTDNSTTNADMPKFADAEVQKYVEDYTTFVTGYVEAYKTKDYSKIANLAIKAADWSAKSMDISKKLMSSPDEAAKFGNYMTKLSKDMTVAMTGK